MNIGFSLVTLL